MNFRVLTTDVTSKARIGRLDLEHGSLETPVFMPVGTQATVKALDNRNIAELGFSLILANTYHLFLRPGSELIRQHGGLHGFTKWQGNFLTDSGGFQVFSLAKIRKIKEEGVFFQSHIDGSKHLLSPEVAVNAQVDFNSDIQMVLDVCTAPDIPEKKALEALQITSRWASRAKTEWLMARERGYRGELFGIVQGNFFPDLRRRSASELLELDFPGYAIGGLSVGEDYSQFKEFLALTAALLPSEKPRYLMGIGTPEYILDAVEQGIDMFDCVLPTRIARNGSFFTRFGRIAIKNERYKTDLRPIDDRSPIAEYSRAYLRHLFKSEEILAAMLATRHNLWFLQDLIRGIHEAIVQNQFAQFKAKFLDDYQKGMPD